MTPAQAAHRESGPVGPSEAAGRVRDWLEARRDEMIDWVERLARLESPSSDPGSQDPVFAVLAAELAERGFRTRRLRGRATGGALWASRRGRERGRPRQLLLGHVDTVWPRGSLETLPLRREGERLSGPGVYDMKGGLTQMVFALRALEALGLAPALEPVVLLNADEEIGSPETGRHVRRLAPFAERAFVMEPSLGPEGRLKTARKGVGRFRLRVVGRAAHAGLDPEAGVSAILELSHVIQHLQALADRERGVTVNVGVVEGGLGPNVVAPEARARVEARVLSAADAGRVEAAIRALPPTLPGARIEVEGGFAKAPMEPTPRNRALFERARSHAAALGFELGEGTAGGASDGNTTSLFTATLDGLGAVGGGAHAPDEFLDTGRLAERAALLALLLVSPPAA